MPLFVVLTSQIDPIYPNSPVNFITSHKWRINRYCYHSMEQMQEHSTLFIVKRYHYLGIINFWNFFFTTPKLIWIVVSKKKKQKNRVSPYMTSISYQCMSQKSCDGKHESPTVPFSDKVLFAQLGHIHYQLQSLLISTC